MAGQPVTLSLSIMLSYLKIATAGFFISSIIYSKGYAQQDNLPLCADSSYHINIASVPPYPDSLVIFTRINVADGGYITGGNLFSNYILGFGLITRFNKDGSIRWSKRIYSNPNMGSQDCRTIAEAANGNILIFSQLAIPGASVQFALVVLNADGNIINQQSIGLKYLSLPTNVDFHTDLIIKNGTDSLMLMAWAETGFGGGAEKYILMPVNNNGNIGTVTVLTPPNIVPVSVLPWFNNGFIKNGKLIVFGTSNFANQCEVSGAPAIPATALFCLQINLLTRTIDYQKAYCAPRLGIGGGYYDYSNYHININGYNTKVFLMHNGTIKMVRSYLFMQASPAGITNRLFSVSTFDSLFNHLHSEYIITDDFMRDGAIQEITIDSAGKTHLSFSDFETQSIYYALADKNNHFLLQKKIPFPMQRKYRYATFSNQPDAGWFTAFDIYSYQQNSFNIDQFRIQAKDTGNACFGTDTSFLRYQDATVSPINWQGQFTVTTDTAQTIPATFITADYPFITTPVCTQKHVCDTLKLHAPDTVCSIISPVTITAFKNPLCDGRINFQFDTLAVSSFSQPDDTTLNLAFRNSWKGKIVAASSSCPALQDSVEIVVSQPLAGINLGKDTMFCKGHTYLLKSPAGLQKYKWQDGSTDSSFTANEPGTYFVTAMDYCGRTYSDTIQITMPDVSLSAGMDTAICQNERIVLKASDGFTNYQWQPVYNISDAFSKNTTVYPDITTSYSVSAEPFPGCVLSDTVIVTVKDCPQKFYVPTAFTPDKNGINDTFLPIISGVLTGYEFTVYNRWGQIVFKTKDSHIGWDGTYKGVKQNGNTFIWVCTYQFYNQPVQIKRGTVVLIR